MIVFARKNKSESNEKLLLRYKKMFFQTRISNKVKSERYATRDDSERKVREKAIMRDTYRALNRRIDA